MKIPHVGKLSIEELERLLHTGTFTTFFLVDDFYTKYEFTTEGDWFVMRVRGVCGNEARKICAQDFVRLLINVCLYEAEYEHDPTKELLYRESVDDREAGTESLKAVDASKGCEASS